MIATAIIFLAGVLEGVVTALAVREFGDWFEAVAFWIIATWLIAGALFGGLHIVGYLS